MKPDEATDTTFAGSTSAIGKALLDAPVMRPWPPTLEEARAILAGQPYEVLERIGHGGMGAVFKVRNLEPGMGRFEAVKIRRPEARDDDLFRERFLREIGTLAQLRHPGVTTVFRSGDSAECYLWFSMEFLEGRSLAELLIPGLPPLSPERVLDITRQLCITLQFIHQAGRLHRDLKPANVMVCDDGSVRLLDFGIARPAEPSPISLLTRPGDNPHTPDYAAPEQKTGGPVDERADLYGLGRIVTDMIGPDQGTARERHPRFPQRLLDLADDLLAYDRDDRPNSAADVIEKLGQIEPGSPGFWGKDRCPFRGLEAYQPEHAEIFFGRDAAIRRGLEILQPSPDIPWTGFLLITGASGSGKSSLARAGLGPALLRGAHTSVSDNANIVPIICDLSTIRPENDCLLPPLARLLAADPAGLAEALRDPGTDFAACLGLFSNNDSPFVICLILDQFEHFFRMNLPHSAGARFLAAIARLARSSGIAVLVTLRSDFYHLCARHPVLMELKDGRQLDVAPPQPWELAAMLRLGARAGGLSFESGPDGRGLDDVLLVHAHRNPQVLPLLSYVLEQLWERRDIPTNTLRFADYEALGGFEGAVGIKARETLKRFNDDFPNDSSDALDDLLHLVVDASESGEEDAFVCRRASPAELSAATPSVRHLTERLVAARLLVQDSSGLTLAHEALLSPAVVSRWKSLSRWLEKNASDMRIRKRVAIRCRDWLGESRLADLLLSAGVLLADATSLLSVRPSLFSVEQRDFIQQSVTAATEQSRRSTRRKRYFIAVLALLAITVDLSALWKAKAERRQRELVQQQELAARKAASEADFAVADFRLGQEDLPGALAYLADALRKDPANEKAMIRVVSLLESQLVPASTIRADGEMFYASFSPNGKWVVTAASDNAARVWDARTGEPVSEPMRHDDKIRSVCFSPDGNRVLTASWDKTARIWEAETGKSVGQPMRHDLWVNSACFSPDGNFVVTAAWDACAMVWDAKTGKPVSAPMGHHDQVCSANFSPDGKWVVTASEDRTARVWDARTGKPVSKPMSHMEIVFSASFSPDSKRVVTASGDGSAQVWDAATGDPLGERMQHGGAVLSASFSPDGKCVVTASNDKTALVWEASTGSPMGVPMRHDAAVLSASFSSDGRRVVTASKDKTARVWEASTGKPTGGPMRHAGPIVAASFSCDDRWVVTASQDKTVRVWDSLVARPPAGLPLWHAGAVSSARFSPDCKMVVTACFDKSARVWDATTGKPIGKPMQHDGYVCSASFSPDGERLVTASNDGNARLWERRTGEPVGVPMRFPGNFASAIFSPDSRLVVTFTLSGDGARVWDARTGKPVCGPLGNLVHNADFSPDSRLLVTVGADCAAQIWDVQAGTPMGCPIQFDGFVASASFSPDGRWIVTADGDNRTAHVWDVKTGEPIGNPMVSEGRVNSAIFSANGKRIVTTSSDGTARVWIAQTGKPVGQPMRHAGEVGSAELSPDGKWVVTSADDHTARLWDAETGKPLGEPMSHQDSIRSANFSPNGKQVLTASDDKTARIWDAAIKGETAPAWLADLSEAAGGLTLTTTGALEQQEQDYRQMKDKLCNLAGDDDLARFGRWFVADPSTRTISPLSAITVPEFVSRCIKENASDSVEQAYRMDPGQPLIVASLAKFDADQDKALFLCRHALQRARSDKSPERIEQVRSIAKSIFPDLPEFRDPTKAPSPTTH